MAFGDRDGADGLTSAGASTGNLAAAGAAEGADPQSIGALARAMRTQCTQLVGHLMVLLRNLTEACQGALKEKGSLPGEFRQACFQYISTMRSWFYQLLNHQNAKDALYVRCFDLLTLCCLSWNCSKLGIWGPA